MNRYLKFPESFQSFINPYALLFFLFLFFQSITAQNKPRIFINEFLAANLTTNPDMVDFGDFSDWIELYNDESTAVVIGGYYLTDDLSQPKKWQFPQNAVIPAKGFYLVWADGYNDVPGKHYVREWWPHTFNYTTKWCHTNFKLDKNIERIGLFDLNGNIIDSVSYINQADDVSFGRQPDGSGNWFYFGEPTPMKSNTGQTLTDLNYSGEVDFSKEGGFYQSAINVTLKSKSGSGIIRYTTDGSMPTSFSLQYNSSIAINKNTILRARLFENAKLPGKTFTNTYFINEKRNLPVVSLVTNPKFLWDKDLGIYINTYKERQIPVSLEYFPLNSARAFYIDAGARIGGENIYRFAEKPINIYASSDYGYSHISYNIFNDLPFNEYKRLYLRNGGDDWPNTMFRDGLQVNLLKKRIGNSMQDFKPSVLYLNGQYWGIYNLREKIDEQYFLLHYNVDPSNLDHLESSNTVISGDNTDFVNLLNFAAANSLSNQSNYNYVAARIDVHNLMDFVIVQDFIGNSSWSHNREVWRDNNKEKLWRWILVDMDRGFDAARIQFDRFSDIYSNFDLFRELLENTGFKNEFVQRYAEHLNHTFNISSVIPKIDSLKSLIENEMPRHVQKWGTYIDTLTIDIWGQTPGITSIDAWNSEVQNLKDFANSRAAYAIQYLSSKLKLSGTAKLTINSNVANQGKITINNFSEKFGEQNIYFKNIPITITAYPPPGYKFKQWKAGTSGVIGTNPSMEYTLTSDSELTAEFENSGSILISSSINDTLTLSRANSPYYITSDVTVAQKGYLIVEPGTEFFFSPGVSLYVEGTLKISGTESEPVILDSYYSSEKWGAVCFNNSSGISELKYVKISNATKGNDKTNFFAAVSSLNSSVSLLNVTFDNVKLPVSTQWSNMIIDGCTFKNVNEIGDYINSNGGNLTITNSVFEGNNFADMDAVDLGFMKGTTEIKNNIIRNFTGGNSDGIDLGDGCINVRIENNLINNCKDKGVSIGGGSNAILERNSIAGCNEGVGIKDSLSFVEIRNCTFYSNNTGVACFEKQDNRGGGRADILNSIFAESSDADYSIDSHSNIIFGYSLSDKNTLPGTTNKKVKPFMIDPDSGNFHLRVDSPCIDNGDSQTAKDEDGSRADIGAFQFAGLSSPDIVINEINYNSASDFDTEDWIELYNSTSHEIDLSGWVFADENESPSYIFETGTILQSQSYLVVCRSKKLFKSLFPAINNYTGDMDSGLDGNGEFISLYNKNGKLVDSLHYLDKSPWPGKADGTGSTLELQNPKLDNGTGANWKASVGHGTPGEKNSVYITGIQDNAGAIPGEYKLMQNYPNPFNPSTTINFEIPVVEAQVTLKVYDVLGREIKTLINGNKSPGNYEVEFDGTGLVSGVYFVRMTANAVGGKDQFTSVIKMLLMK